MTDAEDPDFLPESETEGADADERSDKLQAVHKRAMERFDAVAVPQTELRAESLEDRVFVTIAGGQWQDSAWQAPENTPQPEIDKITPSLEKIETDYRENRLTVDFVPANDDGDAETADTLDGCYRADSNHFKADEAHDNAFQEGIRGGFGAWLVGVDLDDPQDPASEHLRINPGIPIVDADQCVFFYGGVRYDKSDAQAAFIITAELKAIAEDKWGDDVADFERVGLKWQWQWYTPDVTYIARYYEVEEVDDDLLTFTQPLSGEKQRHWRSDLERGEIKNLTDQGWTRETRKLKRKRVHKYILSGSGVLKDCGYIPGPNIPIVPFYYRREFVDNQEYWQGRVRKRKDRQRIYNSGSANIVETMATSPREVPIVSMTQMAGTVGQQTYAEIWSRQNIDRLPFVPLEPLLNADGSVAVAGPIGKIEAPALQPATVAALQIASADLTDDNDNADEVKANVSADAMDIAAERVDSKSQIGLDNMAKSHKRAGEIYLGMFREVCYEPGRKVPTLTADGQDGTATIAELQGDANGVYKVRNDLSQGTYKVVASVQESTTTKQQKTVRQNTAIADVAVKAGDQQLAQAALLTAVMNMDGEGMDSMKGYARNRLIGLGVEKPTPEEKKQIDQAQQGQQPSAADTALKAKAGLDQASAVDKLAAAHLKGAQADAIGGPDAAPEVPSGLAHVSTIADTADKLAGAGLKEAQAEHLRSMTHVKAHEAGTKRILTGHQIELERRQQALAEQQPQERAA
jgi:hypothetical protein